MVGVENRDEVHVEVRQRVVDITGLGVRVLLARQVVRPEGRRQFTDPLPAPVVEHPGFVCRFNGRRRGDGRQQYLAGLVVGCDQYRDA